MSNSSYLYYFYDKIYEVNNMPVKALYIHIPFCDHICIYCDFYKMLKTNDEVNRYFNYLIKEIDLKKEYLNNIETIYIGGGTPSVIDENNLLKLFNKLSLYIDLSKIKEFTFECNPKDVNLNLISIFKKYNVNRISLGVQTLNNHKLKILNRNHIDNDVYKAINLLKDNNIDNISCDLIYGLRDDNIELLKNDAIKLINLGVKHLSCYTLIVEDRTILKHMIDTINYKPLDDDKEALIYYNLSLFLEKNNFKRYEISNYCLEGYESKHNLIYWMNENYIGIGAGASYFINNVRYKNISNLKKYYSGIENNQLVYEEKEVLTKEDDIFNEIMLKLRTSKGINLKDFSKKYNISFKDVTDYNKHINEGNLIEKDGYVYINPKKTYVMNSILVDLII